MVPSGNDPKVPRLEEEVPARSPPRFASLEKESSYQLVANLSLDRHICKDRRKKALKSRLRCEFGRVRSSLNLRKPGVPPAAVKL